MLDGGLASIRTEIINGQGFTEVIFRRRGTLKRLLALVLIAVMWAFGALFGALMTQVTSSGSPGFAWVWLVLWLIGGPVAIAMLLWNALRVESLIAQSNGLTLMRRLMFWKSPIIVPATRLSRIGWFPDDPAHTVRVNGRRVPQTGIAIVHDGGVLRCARGISEAEAGTALAALGQRLVIPRTRD